MKYLQLFAQKSLEFRKLQPRKSKHTLQHNDVPPSTAEFYSEINSKSRSFTAEFRDLVSIENAINVLACDKCGLAEDVYQTSLAALHDARMAAIRRNSKLESCAVQGGKLLQDPDHIEKSKTNGYVSPPEMWSDRSRKRENPVEFIKRVYAPWLCELRRADIRGADRPLYVALAKWIQRNGPLSDDFLPTKSELLKQEDAAASAETVRQAARIARRAYRNRAKNTAS